MRVVIESEIARVDSEHLKALALVALENASGDAGRVRLVQKFEGQAVTWRYEILSPQAVARERKIADDDRECRLIEAAANLACTKADYA